MKELRSFELRKSADNSRQMSGYAVRFNSLSQDLGGFKEIIAPSAINLTRDFDVLALFGHDSNRILGRTTSNTLQLSTDSTGLKFRCQLPANPDGDTVAELLARGDLHQCSFGMTVNQDQWTQDAQKNIVRTVTDLTLYEISVVGFPAYTDTSVALRSAPATFRDKILNRQTRNANDCNCDCEECLADNCADCTGDDCTDDNCELCAMQSRAAVLSCILRRRMNF